MKKKIVLAVIIALTLVAAISFASGCESGANGRTGEIVRASICPTNCRKGC